jgi:HNH endonuclease
MKKCSKCKIEKLEKDFSKRKRSKDGLDYHCKECHNEKERIWRKNNPEKSKKIKLRWLNKNREKYRKIQKISFKKWKENNLDLANAIFENDRHRRQTIYKTTDITAKWLMELKKNAKTCPICGIGLTSNTSKYHPTHYNLDHIIILSLGGTHTMNNVRYICFKCNMERSRSIKNMVD